MQDLSPPISDDGSYTLTVRVSDNETYTDADTTVTIFNKAPTATFSDGGEVSEGSEGTVSFTDQLDPSDADTDAGFTYSYDFDDDGSFEIAGSTESSATVPASFLDDGPGSRTVKAAIIDKDGGYTDYTTTIDVTNTAPQQRLPTRDPSKRIRKAWSHSVTSTMLQRRTRRPASRTVTTSTATARSRSSAQATSSAVVPASYLTGPAAAP